MTASAANIQQRRDIMEFSSLIAERYSVRKFSPEPVNEAAVQAILQAARLAPMQ